MGGTDFGDTYAGSTGAYWNQVNTASFGSALSYVPEIPWNNSCASELIANYHGFAVTYGANGFCNDPVLGEVLYLSTIGGSGGPSGCAFGAPSLIGAVTGTCAGYPKPSWQVVPGNPNDGVRDLPDVSLFAANGVWGHSYVLCFSGGTSSCQGDPSTWPRAGGTSFSAPILAGIQALINQRTGDRQGNPNPVYYALARDQYGPTGNTACDSTLGNGIAGNCIFNDVTQGDNNINCVAYPNTGILYNCYLPSGVNGVFSTANTSYQPAYRATPGWDFTTGLGTVNAFNLVMAWPLPPMP